ncbi:hypothetical protein [Streptomyces sp. SCSIO ZS0520]|uniref:hypothetical protein n=1 Tax=Streptomyces sp. SCSIO ZS0520 TaxID=2892996 RepID=UPI0021D98F31|nr:hypothetical protein [Streptomyces sp. SCSIO ZS0520]
MRLTATVRQQLLDQNDGFETTTTYRSRNYTEERRYRITGGRLYIRVSSNTSWADSRSSNEGEASDDETRRFLRKYLGALNTDGL